jgi:CHAD domain-containing protein
MVTQKSYLFNYYKNETQSFFKSIRRLHKDFDPDELHRLRISIKRIRTVYRLLEEFSRGRFNAHKHYSFFSETFNLAGKIRELQINRLLILENESSEGKLGHYLQKLERKKERLSFSFKKTINKIDVSKLKREVKKIKKKCKKIEDGYFFNKAYQLMYSEATTIKQLLHTSTKNATIHKIRKHLKILYALVKLSYSIKPSAELKKLGIVTKKTEELLGMWHDRVVLLSSLKKTRTDNLNQVAPIKRLIVKMGEQKEVLLSASLSKMGAILKSLPKQL